MFALFSRLCCRKLTVSLAFLNSGSTWPWYLVLEPELLPLLFSINWEPVPVPSMEALRKVFKLGEDEDEEPANVAAAVPLVWKLGNM